MAIEYVAYKISPENIDYDVYMPEYEIEDNCIWLGGNSHLASINEGMYNSTVDDLRRFGDDINSITLEDTDLADLQQEFERLYKYYFIDFNKLSTRDINRIADIATGISEGLSEEDEREAVAEYLSIVQNRRYTVITLRGVSQSDWIYAIYPIGEEQLMDIIAACYFGMGSEFVYFDYDESKADTYEQAEDLGDPYFWFTPEYADEQALADYLGVTADKIKFFENSYELDDWLEENSKQEND